MVGTLLSSRGVEYPWGMLGQDDIVKSALELPERERAEVARKIIESFDGDASSGVESAWAEEVAQRILDLTQGKATTVEASEALERARSRIKH